MLVHVYLNLIPVKTYFWSQELAQNSQLESMNIVSKTLYCFHLNENGIHHVFAFNTFSNGNGYHRNKKEH